MTLQIIIGVLLLAALAYAWYTERTRRREAELERDLATRRTTLDGIQKKLDENKVAYDEAKNALGAAPIPPHMFEYLGMDKARDTVVADVRSGRLVDPQTGGIVAETPGPDAEPIDTGPRFYEIGPGGKPKTTH